MLKMQKKFSSLFFLLFLIATVFVACSDDGSSAKDSGESAKGEWFETHEATVIGSVFGIGMDVGAQFAFGYAGTWHYGNMMQLEMDSTVELNEYVKDLRLSISFVDTATCNYQNTRILVDGKELECARDDSNYWLCKDFLPSLTESHRLEILLDSAKCGNIKRLYTIVPSKEPGKAWNPSVECRNGYCEKLALNNFFVELGMIDYAGRTYSWELDTLQSRCYLKHGSDSLDLVKNFEPNYDFWNTNHYRRMVVSADSASLAGLMQGDTLATLACAMIYQSWYVHQQLDSIKFYEREVNIQSYQKKRLISAGFTKEGTLELHSADWVPEYVYIRANVNGVHKYYYQHFFSYRGNAEVGFYNDVPLDSIYGGYPSSERDSVQFIVMNNADVGASVEENNIRSTLRFLPYVHHDGVVEQRLNDSTIAVLDSIIDVVTDDAGNVKPEFFFMDAKRIPGYEKE